MPESAVQLQVWVIGLDETEHNTVEELLEELEFRISTTWEPAKGEIEFQTTAFADTGENVAQIRDFEEILNETLEDADVAFSGLDKSRQTTMDKPIKGAYQIQVEK